MSKILVTGASGFIGGHLSARLCREGHQVRCLVRPSSNVDRLASLPVEILRGELDSADTLRHALSGVDVVFHVAGITSAVHRGDMWQINAEAPRHVARACARQSSPPVHILVSSLAAAGPALADRARVESDAPQPVSLYGQSKLAGEHAVREYAPHVPTTIVRPSIVFGAYDPGMRTLVQSLYRHRIHINPGFHSPPLSLIHVDDLVEILLRAAERGERLPPEPSPTDRGFGVYFAASPEYPTYAEIGHWLAPAVIPGKKLRVLHVPKSLAWMIAFGSEVASRLSGKPSILNRDKIREGTVHSWVCSGAKAYEQFNLSPSQSLAEQLRQTGVWYREHGWL